MIGTRETGISLGRPRRIPLMRPRAALVLAATALLSCALSGCTVSSDDAAPRSGSGTNDVSPALTSALSDVERVAVALEGYYRGAGYPTDLDGAVASLEPAGQELSPGNRVATYAYDADAVEFSMCVETEDGAFATYDTAPMSLRQTGETGGCPTG